jgi:hypothetical protein
VLTHVLREPCDDEPRPVWTAHHAILNAGPGRGKLCERRRGRRGGAREGACTGATTMTQPSTLRGSVISAAAWPPQARLCSLATGRMPRA